MVNPKCEGGMNRTSVPELFGIQSGRQSSSGEHVLRAPPYFETLCGSEALGYFVAQMVRAPDYYSGCRRFKSGQRETSVSLPNRFLRTSQNLH